MFPPFLELDFLGDGHVAKSNASRPWPGHGERVGSHGAADDVVSAADVRHPVAQGLGGS